MFTAGVKIGFLEARYIDVEGKLQQFITFENWLEPAGNKGTSIYLTGSLETDRINADTFAERTDKPDIGWY